MNDLSVAHVRAEVMETLCSENACLAAENNALERACTQMVELEEVLRSRNLQLAIEHLSLVQMHRKISDVFGAQPSPQGRRGNDKSQVFETLRELSVRLRTLQPSEMAAEGDILSDVFVHGAGAASSQVAESVGKRGPFEPSNLHQDLLAQPWDIPEGGSFLTQASVEKAAGPNCVPSGVGAILATINMLNGHTSAHEGEGLTRFSL